jgi:ATP-binding cassette subfamily F protein uup
MKDVSVGYGGEPLIDHIDFQINPGDRICLLGRNGVGKSTLMKLICGQIEPEKGDIAKAPSLSVTYLTQAVPTSLKGTVFDVVSQGLGPNGTLLADYHLLSQQITAQPDNKILLQKADKLHHTLDIKDAWHLNRYVDMIVEKIKLDPDATVENLSAGMKRRVLLAQALVRKPEILLLDEPTNHLDIDAITWLEEFLSQYDQTLMFVSHDRAFVKKLATSIIDLDRGQLKTYQCDYQTYLRRKEAALEEEATQNALFDKKLAQQEIWIRKGIKARGTRNEGQVHALEKMREERNQRKELIGSVNMQLQNARLSGRLVIDAKDISFAYNPDEPIIRDFSTLIMRSDKIGIIGPNGSGKTTLLRVLLKELAAQQGSIRHGTKLEIAYFDQSHKKLNYDKSVYDNIADGTDTITINGKPQNIIGYLQSFLFSTTQSRNSVSNLSGGERNRLLLARLFAKPSNILVLDEPTNDLDMESLDILEDFLLNYPGTILLVSHDREFLNKVVTSTLALEGNGTIKEYVGGYDDWLRQSKKTDQPKQPEKNPPEKKSRPKQTSDQPRKLTFKEKKELEQLPTLIETLESEQQKLHNTMTNPDFYKNNTPQTITATTNKLTQIKTQLEKAYTRWQSLDKLKP